MAVSNCIQNFSNCIQKISNCIQKILNCIQNKLNCIQNKINCFYLFLKSIQIKILKKYNYWQLHNLIVLCILYIVNFDKNIDIYSIWLNEIVFIYLQNEFIYNKY